MSGPFETTVGRRQLERVSAAPLFKLRSGKITASQELEGELMKVKLEDLESKFGKPKCK